LLTFNDYIKGEKSTPTALPKTPAKLTRSVIKDLSRSKLIPARDPNQIGAGESEDSVGDIATNLSHQIMDLNRLIVTDPSCAVVAKRLSEMLLRLHFLILLTTVGGDWEADRTKNA
jgi:hypothetical protein